MACGPCCPFVPHSFTSFKTSIKSRRPFSLASSSPHEVDFSAVDIPDSAGHFQKTSDGNLLPSPEVPDTPNPLDARPSKEAVVQLLNQLFAEVKTYEENGMTSEFSEKSEEGDFFEKKTSHHLPMEQRLFSTAAKVGRADLVNALLHLGADPRLAHNSFGETPLYVAADAGNYEVSSIFFFFLQFLFSRRFSPQFVLFFFFLSFLSVLAFLSSF